MWRLYVLLDPDVVPVLLLICDVEEIVDEESRTSRLNHNQSIFFFVSRTLKDDAIDDGQLT